MVEAKVVESSSIQLALFQQHAKGPDLLWAGLLEDLPDINQVEEKFSLTWKKSEKDWNKHVLVLKETPKNSGVLVDLMSVHDDTDLRKTALDAVKEGCNHVIVAFPDQATFQTGWVGSCFYCGDQTVGNYFE